jgi:hypothetical protein
MIENINQEEIEDIPYVKSKEKKKEKNVESEISEILSDDSTKLIGEMNKDYSYPAQNDPDLQYKLYKKREFYNNRIPEQPIIKNYDDIKNYRDRICSKTEFFHLREHQLLLSNFINPDTPYKGIILFHGLGTGKCTGKDVFVHVNNKYIKQEQIWKLAYYDVTIDEEGGEWSKPKIDLYVDSFEQTSIGFKMIKKKVHHLYREQFNGLINYIKLDDGRYITTSDSHKLMSHMGWLRTDMLSVNDIIYSFIDGKIKRNRIIEKKKLHYADYIYDLEIDETHNYVGNGFICHNTCSAIAVAENFKTMVQKYGTRIHILVPGPLLKEGWKRALIDCTGNTYLKNIDKTLLTSDSTDKLYKLAQTEIQQYYRIMSYKGFYRRVIGEKIVDKKVETKKNNKKTIYRKTEEGEFERDVSVDRIYNLNNSLLIVDESHNLTGSNAYGDSVQKIINESTNLKILLLTGTPMKNLADDIIDLVNFIRPINFPIERNEIFEGEGWNMKIKENGINYFKKMASGYFSHVRGDDPMVNAIKVNKGIIPNGLQMTQLTPCHMEPFQKKAYDIAIESIDDALDRKSQAVANFTFPVLDEKKNIVGNYGKIGLNMVKNQIQSNSKLLNKKICEMLNTSEKNDMVYMSEDGKTITGKIFHKNYLKTFSIKFYEALKKINKLFYGKKGPRTCFIYSNLVKVGIELFKEVLNQNGYIEFNDDKTHYKVTNNTKCYFCGKLFENHNKKLFYKNKKGEKKEIPKHEFHPATYVSVTGKTEDNVDYIPEEKKEMLDNIFNNIANVNGQHIKFILGSKVMNEGVSLSNIKEVHILDVPFHFGRIDQVVGRAVRFCSHYQLMTSRNVYPKVNIYKYAVVLDNELSSEIDLYVKAEKKYLLVKKIERAIKEVAIDCPLNLYGNIYLEEIKKYENCEKEDNCPQICDFTNCNFKCNSEILNTEFYDPERKIYKNLTRDLLDYSTYTHGLARNEINFAKDRIKELYIIKYVSTLPEIIKYVKSKYEKSKMDLFDEFFIYKALDELTPITENDFMNFSDILTDRFNNLGYIIFVNKYYIFQPFDQKEDVPMYYRTIFNKPIEQHFSLHNYIKHLHGYKKRKETDEDKEIKEVCYYDFESVADYYNNRNENDYVGVLDCEISGSTDDAVDVFKIREKRSKILDKKRGTGIPSLKGAVCDIAKDKQYLEKLMNVLKISKNKKENRKTMCDKIKEKMLELEKYSTNNKTYVMIPANHKIYPFPYNLLDRVHFIQDKIGKSSYVKKENKYIISVNELDNELIKKYNAQKVGNKYEIKIE